MLAIIFSKRMHSGVRKSDFGTQFGAEENGGLSSFHSMYFYLICIWCTSTDQLHHLKEGEVRDRKRQKEEERGGQGKTGQGKSL